MLENLATLATCGGILAVAVRTILMERREAARRAAEAMISEFRPSHIVSVGFAGALDPALRVGAVLEPRVVINGGDGSRLDTGKGKGTLLSFSVVAGPNQKRKLHRAYGADAVDMEAAAVASTAQLHAVTFGALKVISDTADFVMPPVDKFVASNGSFRASNFALFIAVRPWFWGATITLAQNSKRASKALQAAIMQYVDTVEPRSIAEHP